MSCDIRSTLSRSDPDRSGSSRFSYRLITQPALGDYGWQSISTAGDSGRMSSRRLLITAMALSALLPAAARSETTGVASWYGGKHDGRRTSSGEIFDQDGFTAASRSLPLGSRIRVTMQETGQSVVVTVNDRMGGHGAMIDLSRGAAREIGLLGRGRGTVSIASASDVPLEVAEATEDETSDVASDAPRGRRRTRRGGRSAGADRRCCHAMSVALVRHSAPRPAARHRL